MRGNENGSQGGTSFKAWFQMFIPFTYWDLATHLCVVELGHRWFRWYSFSPNWCLAIDHTSVVLSWLSRTMRNTTKCCHYNYVIMTTMASQIISLTVVYSTVYSDADQRKHQSSASLALVRGIYRWPVKSPHTRKMFPFGEVIMLININMIVAINSNQRFIFQIGEHLIGPQWVMLSK